MEWISVKEKLPNKGQRVLCSGISYCEDCYGSEGKALDIILWLGDHFSCQRCGLGEISHWMPLPNPPEKS
jgi:hypothetical protein